MSKKIFYIWEWEGDTCGNKDWQHRIYVEANSIEEVQKVFPYNGHL